MKKCVEIEMSDDGTVMVGMKEKDESDILEDQKEGYDMQPADNLDAALSMAKDMLSANPEADAQNNQAFESGYKKAGGPMMMDKMKGGM